MSHSIRRLTDADLEAVVDLSLRAWAPVFDSMRGALGEAVYRQLYPDWRAMQARGVAQVCRSATEAWVADVEGAPWASWPSSTTTRPTTSRAAARSR